MGKHISKSVGLLLFLCSLLNLTGCVSRHYQPIATLNELAQGEELVKARNWYEQSNARSAAGALMGMTLVLAPLGLIIALVPSETDLTIAQIGDIATVRTYESDGVDVIGYTDGALSIDYYVTATSQGQCADEGGVKLSRIAYTRYKDKKTYCEVRKIFKSKDGKYFHFRMPLVILNQNNESIYAFDHSFRVVEIFNIGQMKPLRLRLASDSGGEIQKTDKDLLEDFSKFLETQEISFTEIPCSEGSECKRKKQEKDHTRD